MLPETSNKELKKPFKESPEINIKSKEINPLINPTIKLSKEKILKISFLEAPSDFKIPISCFLSLIFE